jgi:hypothetical protein
LHKSFDLIRHKGIVDGLKNRSILILFRHQIVAESMNPYGRLILAAVISNGTRSYNSVTFGFLKTRYNAHVYQEGDILPAKCFKLTFHTDFEAQPYRDRFVRSFSIPTIQCAKFIAKLTVEAPMRKYEWFASTGALFSTFRKAVSKTCGIPHTTNHRDASSAKAKLLDVNNSIYGDDLNSGATFFVDKIKRLAWSKKQAGLPLRTAPVVRFLAPAQTPKLLIYQRDKSRRIVNLDDTVRALKSLLDKEWRVEVIVHDNELSPCTLLQTISEASAMLTPHGFQSTSMLFQPRHSVLIEVHPALFHRPEVYGYVQAGFRQSFGIARSYLTEESVATTALGRLAVLLLASAGIDNDRCLHSPACRFFSRLQDVRVSTPFIEKIATFLKTHFIHSGNSSIRAPLV